MLDDKRAAYGFVRRHFPIIMAGLVVFMLVVAPRSAVLVLIVLGCFPWLRSLKIKYDFSFLILSRCV